MIQFDGSIFAGFAAVRARAVQSGADVVITYDAGNTVTLKSVQLASLHADDFDFV